MPDWKSLRVGDQIRLLCVPKADLEQRVCEVRDGAEMAGWTADTLERIIASDPVVFIERIDEYGCPWFKRELPSADGDVEYHSLTITDDESWEYVSPA
jgi:hypothetical protein